MYLCVHACQHLEENPKASGEEIQQVLKEFTDAVIGANADTSENVQPVSARKTLRAMTTFPPTQPLGQAYDNISVDFFRSNTSLRKRAA